MPTSYTATAPKKYLDADGLTHFAQKLNNYPTNDVIGAVIDGVQDALDEKLDVALAGSANGVATLGSDGKVPSTQLPESMGATYTLSQDPDDGHIVTLTSSSGSVQQITIPDNDTTYEEATTSASGLMSSSDKSKLNGIAAGANVSNIAYDSTNKKITKTINGTTSDVVSAANLKTDMNLVKGDVGLGNVENKSSATIRGELTSTNVTTALGYTPINSSLKGANNGIAELDASGKVPSTQLPSYVDDVLEYSTISDFPFTGESGKIYVDISTNKTYRWSGTTYTEISPSLALGETSSTAFRGDYGKIAYDHAFAVGTAYSNGLYKITTNAQGHVTLADAVEKSDITALGIPAQDTTYESKSASSGGTAVSLVTTGEKYNWNSKASTSTATTSANGLMSSSDKVKLDGIASGATANTGTVTSVAAGAGLAGGTITTSGTVKANLTSETKLSNEAADSTETAGRVYPVRLDKNGKLAVNVPWTDNNTTYTFDGTYNASTNKAATVSTVTNAINALDGNLNSTTPGAGKTLTAFSETNGVVSATFGNISITKSQVSDFPTLGSAAAKGVTDNSSATAVTSTDTNLITGRTLYYAGYTKNTGTITGINMNGASKGTSGVVDLGTVITSHQDISGKADKSSTVSNVSYDSTNNKITKTINGTTSDVVTAATLKTAMSLGNVENKSSATIREEITSGNVTNALGFTPLNASLKGANNGVAELDSAGKVPASQLPSYVDDVLEYDKQSSFPTTGETGKIYVAQDTNKTYRWSGTAYVEISPSLALGETSSTAYRGDRGKAAYDHASAKGSAFASGLYKITTNSEGHVTAATAVAKADITGLGIPGSDTNTHRPIQVNGTQILGDNTTALNLKAGSNVSVTNSSGTVTIAATDTTYSDATTFTHGLMSTTDKTKMDGMGMVTYGTCSTAAETAAKVVTLSNANWQLKVGSIIAVKFTVTNTYSATAEAPITLDVNNTGAKSIWYNNAANPTGTNTGIFGYANRHIFFIYDGTYWVWMNMGALDGNSNTVPSAQCETAADTAKKTATLTNYTLTANTWVHVNMRYTNTYNGAITMNINSKGAKPIYINGAASSASNKTLPAGTYLVYYDGTNYQFRTDGKLPGSIAGDAATVGGHTVGIDVPSNAKFTDTTYSSKTAASGGTDVSLVTTGEKYTWNNKSNLTIGTSSTTAAAGNHTHGLSMATSSGTNAITLAASTKYQLTAGGSTYIFTTPPNTTYSAISDADIDALFS